MQARATREFPEHSLECCVEPNTLQLVVKLEKQRDNFEQ